MNKETARVLLVDNDNSYIDLFINTFKYFNTQLNGSLTIDIDVAHNFEEAINFIDSDAMYNFIIICLEIPGGGFNLLNEINDRSSMSIIIASSDKIEFKEECKDLGFYYFQNKNNDMEELFGVICSVFFDCSYR